MMSGLYPFWDPRSRTDRVPGVGLVLITGGPGNRRSSDCVTLEQTTEVRLE